MPDTQPPAASLGLAAAANASLVELFASIGHRPSPEQWDAIRDLLEHLERAARGQLAPAVYVSAIPAGTGKSSGIAAFAQALVSDPAWDETGVLITCNRITEVKDMAGKLCAHRHKLRVIVGEDYPQVRAMGGLMDAADAQVVISTHEALRRTLRTTQSFDDAARFHYRGHRRPVLVWDEAIAFNRPVVLDSDAMNSLAGDMRGQSASAVAMLKRWSLELDEAPDGQCQVPDFEAAGVDFHKLEEAVMEDAEKATQVKALEVLSGNTGHVMRDNLTGATVVTHTPELPPNLLPVIVTDASAARGVHHESYVQMARSRRVVHLRQAGKTYRNMTLRIVPVAASRSVYWDQRTTRGKELIEMAVRYVRSVAPAKVLIVSYKKSRPIRGIDQRTIRDAINARLTDDEGLRVHHLTWGSHTATNDHKDVPHVLLMGLSFVPSTVSYAASAAAQDLPMRTADPGQHPSHADVAAMGSGMLRDTTMQAILRGHARMGSDGDCGVMQAVVIQSPQTGLSHSAYREMFPGVRIVDDRSLMPAKPLKGRLKALSVIAIRRLNGGEDELRFPSLREELRVTRSDFGKLVQQPAWQLWMKSQNLAIVDARCGGNIRAILRQQRDV